MALNRYTCRVDGTIPIAALLYPDEELLASQDNTGIYDGPQKAPLHQDGTVHVTTHRLFFIDSRLKQAHISSFEMDLVHVKYTTYYAGLFTSSPKVTMFLSAGPAVNGSAQELNSPSKYPSAGASSAASVEQGVPNSWECEVCGEKNPSGRTATAAQVCSLCGVRRSSMPIMVKQIQMQSQTTASSSSLPSVLLSPSPSPSPASSSPSPAPTSSKPLNVACTACTFLNHPSLRECEVCSTPLPRSQSLPSTGSSTLAAKSAPTTRAVSPAPPDDLDATSTPFIKLSFRKGGDKAFYAELKRSLLRKAWLGKAIGKAPSEATGSRSGGISGIMRTVEISAMDTSQGMSNALMDLETLRIQAKDMVRLAAELNERLTAVSAAASPGTTLPSHTPSPYSSQASLAPEPEEATFIRSSLSQLGLQMQNAPVTHDMIRDESKWVDELAKELAGVLVGKEDGKGKGNGMMRERGIVGLDEVWGGWNRARGVALIPPSTFLSVLPHLLYHTDPPVQTRTFPSGLTVLHTSQFTAASFTARLSSLLTMNGPQTKIEVATEEGLTIGLANEMIEDAERLGAICRDEGIPALGVGGGGVGGMEVRWYPNVFTRYIWDGQDS